MASEARDLPCRSRLCLTLRGALSLDPFERPRFLLASAADNGVAVAAVLSAKGCLMRHFGDSSCLGVVHSV